MPKSDLPWPPTWRSRRGLWPWHRDPYFDASRGGLVIPVAWVKALVVFSILEAVGVGTIIASTIDGKLIFRYLGIAIAAAAPFLIVIARPWRTSFVVDRAGIRYATALRTTTVAWADVIEVIAYEQVAAAHIPMVGIRAYRAAYSTRRKPRFRFVPGAKIEVPARTLAPDPLVTFWTLVFYSTHPEARDELADERCADRVARRDLGQSAFQ